MHKNTWITTEKLARSVATIALAMQTLCATAEANQLDAAHAKALSPRLFHATKEDKSIFLLAVSHIGFDEERDEYADEVIRYVIRRVGTIYDESAAVGTTFNAANQHECNDGAWSTELKAKVVQSVTKATRDSFGQSLAVGQMPEGALYWLLTVFGGAHEIDGTRKSGDLLAGIAVHRGLARLYGVPRKSIETMTELIEIYCAADQSVRVNAVKTALGEGASSPSKLTLDDGRRLLRSSVAELQSDKTYATQTIGQDPASELIFGARNHAWAKFIAQRPSTSSAGADLYALGAGHFVDTVAGPSIVSTLRAQGFGVKRIASISDVIAVLPSLPVHVRTGQALHLGGTAPKLNSGSLDQATCTLVGVNTLCFASLRSGEIVNWVDSRAAFTFTTCAPSVLDSWGRNHCKTVAVDKKISKGKDSPP